MSEMDELYKALLGDKEEKEAFSLSDIINIVKDYFNYLWSKKWIIVAVGLLGGVIGLIHNITKPINYTAHYSFSVATSSGSSSSSMLLNLVGMGNGNLDAFSGDNVLELLRSKELMESALLQPTVYNGDTITFMEYSLIVDSVRAKCESGELEKPEDEGMFYICDIQFPYGQERSTFSREQDSVLMAKAATLVLKNVASSRRDKKLSFMDYSFTYPDEAFAKEFSKIHLQTAHEFYISTKTEMVRKNVASFERRADSVRKELDRSLTRRAVFLDSNKDASGLYISSQAQKIQTDIELLAATYSEIMKNVETLKLDLVRETPLINTIDTPKYPLENDKTRKLKSIALGGIIAGFLICFILIAIHYIEYMKKKMEEEASQLPAPKESNQNDER